MWFWILWNLLATSSIGSYRIHGTGILTFMNSWFDDKLRMYLKMPSFKDLIKKNKALMILDHARFPHHQKHDKNTKDSVEVPFGMASTWCSELHKASTSSWTFFGGPAIFSCFMVSGSKKVGGVYVLVDVFFQGLKKNPNGAPHHFPYDVLKPLGGQFQPSRREKAARPLASGRVL